VPKALSFFSSIASEGYRCPHGLVPVAAPPPSTLVLTLGDDLCRKPTPVSTLRKLSVRFLEADVPPRKFSSDGFVQSNTDWVLNYSFCREPFPPPPCKSFLPGSSIPLVEL